MSSADEETYALTPQQIQGLVDAVVANNERHGISGPSAEELYRMNEAMFTSIDGGPSRESGAVGNTKPATMSAHS